LRRVAGDSDSSQPTFLWGATSGRRRPSESVWCGRRYSLRNPVLYERYEMKKVIGVLCALLMSVGVVSVKAQDLGKLDERLASATAVIDEVMATPDKAIPQSILAGASCVVVIPKYKKGAFVVGAQYGQGVATCRTPRGWSAPVFVQLAGGSFGWQIGGQSTDLVLVAMNQHGLQDMLKNKFKLGADAAASAGPVGRNAQAGTDWKLNAEFLTYSRSKGLFAGIDLDGTVLSQNEDDTRTEYGSNVPFGEVLHGEVPTHENARQFVHTVAKYFVVSQDNH
jgi:lipid-binding SYLF domain-containing protein